MNDISLLEKFSEIGARVKVLERPSRRGRFRPVPTLVSLDIQSDERGEFFEVIAPSIANPEILVLNVDAADRHLLVMVKTGIQKHKFLCGHDERHWFVAAIPENAPVGTVLQAKEALKPPEVRGAQRVEEIPARARNRRKNAAFRRQGEWFFLPAPRLSVNEGLVLRNEPLSRGNGGKPHWVEYCYRIGGQMVYVCGRYPSGVSSIEYARLLAAEPDAKSWNWSTRRRNPTVYVKGTVRHPDHKTIMLPSWHLVVMNTENQSAAMANLAFLD